MTKPNKDLAPGDIVLSWQTADTEPVYWLRGMLIMDTKRDGAIPVLRADGREADYHTRSLAALNIFDRMSAQEREECRVVPR
jgi:hypothetical protein